MRKTFFFLINFFSSTKWKSKSKNEMVKQITLSMKIIGETLSETPQGKEQ